MARPSHPVSECSVVSLLPVSSTCLSCGHTAPIAYHTQRTIATLAGRFHLHLTVRRCSNSSCPRYHQPYRPEAEGSLALPYGEYGLDVITLVGMLRYRHHHSLGVVKE